MFDVNAKEKRYAITITEWYPIYELNELSPNGHVYPLAEAKINLPVSAVKEYEHIVKQFNVWQGRFKSLVKEANNEESTTPIEETFDNDWNWRLPEQFRD